MVLAVDVYYHDDLSAKVVGVLFNWKDREAKFVYDDLVSQVSEYVPGQFYKRELPCILQLLNTVDLGTISCVIVDGHVYVDNQKTYGLGGHLWKALQEKIPIIGIAKKAFFGTENVSFPVLRGQSKTPLFVSSIGIEVAEVMDKVEQMHGKYRIPTLLKYLDQQTRL